MPRRPTRYYPDYGAQLPTSGPDWRWVRALEIVSQGKNVSLKRDGPDIARAIRFIRHTCKIFTGQPMREILKEDPDLVFAYQLNAEGGRRELELQCRVLARESAGVIAVEMGLTKSIVETYCRMFYDVAKSLTATSHIIHNVIKMPMAGPVAPETLMKACAYHHGPHVIEGWLDYLDHQCEAHDLTTADGIQRESIELLIQVHNLPSDSGTHLSLVKRAKLISKMRKKKFRNRTVAEVVSENVSSRLGETRWKEPQQGGLENDCGVESPPSSSKRTSRKRTA